MKNSQKKKASQGQVEKKSLKPVLRFLGIFLGIIALFYLIVAVSDDKYFETYLTITAHIGSFFINIFGGNTSAAGPVISSYDTSMVLSFGCEGTEPIVILLAGLFAIPISLKKKWLPMIVSSVFLYLLNFLRIVILFYIQKYNTAEFDVYHTVYFPIIFILLSVVLLGVSIKWSAKR